jgi:translation initiation factor 1
MPAALDRISDLEKELGLDDVFAAEASRVRIAVESRRYGKAVTVLSGFDAALDLEPVAKELKRTLGTGGTVKDHTIELQGDHRRQAEAWLRRKGYQLA